MTRMSSRTPVDDAEAREDDGRDETETERLDRNWNEMLQELRVTQTGTQILTGFLLTLAFQPRFADLDPFQVDVYLCLVVLASIATVLGLAPVSLHRALFRKRAKPQIVRVADVLLKSTLVCVALLVCGVAVLIFDVVIGGAAGVIAGTLAALLIVVVWLVVPFGAHPKRGASGRE